MDIFEEFTGLTEIYEYITDMGWDSIAYVIIVIAVWLFFKLLHTCISIPRNLSKTKDIESMLEQKVKDYENYLKEQEEKERAAGMSLDDISEVRKSGLNGTPPDNNQTMEEKWKERREFLAMLKKELRRVRDGGDPYNWGSLLDDDEGEGEIKNDEPKPSTSKEGDFEEIVESSNEESQKVENVEEVEEIEEIEEVEEIEEDEGKQEEQEEQEEREEEQEESVEDKKDK